MTCLDQSLILVKMKYLWQPGSPFQPWMLPSFPSFMYINQLGHFTGLRTFVSIIPVSVWTVLFWGDFPVTLRTRVTFPAPDIALCIVLHVHIPFLGAQEVCVGITNLSKLPVALLSRVTFPAPEIGMTPVLHIDIPVLPLLGSSKATFPIKWHCQVQLDSMQHNDSKARLKEVRQTVS